jgi:hypothetical protein
MQWCGLCCEFVRSFLRELLLLSAQFVSDHNHDMDDGKGDCIGSVVPCRWCGKGHYC